MRVSRLALLAALAAPAAAEAFCGFYVGGADAKLFNNATQVVLMREGTRTVLSMQNNYQGPPSDFAMVIPVPVILKKENVKTLDRKLFDLVDTLDAPRLVEYWEQDPCYKPPPEPEYMKYDSRPVPKPSSAAPRDKDLGVKIEAQFTVGEYEIVILSAKDSTGLDKWLKLNKYKIPDGAAPVLKPYVSAGMKFFVAKVDVEKVAFNKDGQAMLSPLRFHYDSTDFSLPVRLGLLNSGGTQDLIVHILSDTRYEVANYKNVTIPTNIELTEDAKTEFGAFYAALFDETLKKNPGAVVTEYAWSAATCDPCPGPALDLSQLATLGADSLPSSSGQVIKGTGTPMVLTRLHARYGKENLGEDLIFKEAKPLEGGREVRDAKGKVEQGAKEGSWNTFQGRYIIRHPWTGPVKCKNPKYGVWGGPPAGIAGSTKPEAGKNLAFAPRGTVTLDKLINQEIPEIGVKPAKKSKSKSEKPKKKADAGGAGSATSNASAALDSAPVAEEASDSLLAHGNGTLPVVGSVAALGLAALFVSRRRK